MKRKIILIISVLIILLFFTSCDFFEYVPAVENNTSLMEAKEKYIEELSNIRSINDYRQDEQRIYLLVLQEGINQINDCMEETKLEDIFTKNMDLIISIKTEKEYLKEETELEQLKKLKEEEYIAKLYEYSNLENYLDKEKELLNYYLELGIKALKENKDIDSYEKIYEAYKEKIEEIKTKDMYIIEWQTSFCKTIDEYVDLERYREKEQKEINALKLEIKEKIIASDNFEEMDAILRDFKVKIYNYPTDEELYAEELEQLKQEAVIELKSYKKLSDYRENEQKILSTLLNSFENIIIEYTTKDMVIILLQEYKQSIDILKSSAQYYEEERLLLIENYYNDLLNHDMSNMTEEDKQEFLRHCEIIKEEMNLIPLKEDITEKYLLEKEKIYVYFAQMGDPTSLEKIKQIQIDKLNIFLDLTNYREAQKIEIQNIILSKSSSIFSQKTYEGVMEEVEICQHLLSQILTNDELWIQEDEQFIEYLRNKYVTILDEPRSFNEANTYEELAQIIDFYAFYQVDGVSFERDTFRVKINFEIDKSADWIKNEVYWYSELLRSAIGIEAKFENKRNLVIHLIPYNFATLSNKSLISNVKKEESYVSYDSGIDASNRTKRSLNFNDFNYYNYKREIFVWNTQQLWYALEHEFVPVCEEGSSAFEVLNKAKEILREIVTDDMSDEEKIYHIFTWFGINVSYDFHMGDYNNSSDMNKFPDENISKLRSFFPEGGLLDNLAVCSGYAKSYLILLRIEGIESLRILARCHQMEGKNSINGRDDGTGGYGSHEFVYIKIGNEWYFSDVEKSSCEARQELQSYVYLLLPPSFETYGFTVMFSELNLSTTIHTIYNRIKCQSQSIFVSNQTELSNFIMQLNNMDKKMQTSIVVDPKLYSNCMDDIVDLIPEGFDFYTLRVGGHILEFILYN